MERTLYSGDSLQFEFTASARLAIVAGLALTYLISAKVGLLFAMVHPSATAIWAPSGLSLAACLLLGSWIWPAISVGAFLANATTYGSIGTSLAIAIGNTLEALVGAYLVRRFAGGHDAFNRTPDALRFVLLAAVLSTAVSATIGVTSLCVAGYASWPSYAWVWFTWWLGDATGDLIVAPLLILWARNPGLHWHRQKAVETGLLLGALLLTVLVVFGGLLPFWGPQFPTAFLCTPVLLWSAFRFGRRQTARVVFFLSVGAIAGTLSGLGPFARGGGNGALLLVQAFVAVTGTAHLIVAIEVEERRRLDETRWRLAAIVESSDDAIVGTTPEGQITSWNDGAARMYGYSAIEAIGNPVTVIIPPDRIDEGTEVLARINDHETIAPFETVRLRKDGSRIDVSLSVSAVKDGDGRVIGTSRIARDITQLKAVRSEREALLRSERAAREAAESTNRAKDEFLAMLGHELRNPLHSISLAARLLENPKSFDNARGIITRQGEHVSRLVDDLLDAARVSSGRIVLKRHPIEMAELVSGCITSLRETRQLERHKVETELETAWVDADADRLAQLVTNLLRNSISYTPAGGKIRVSVRAGEDVVIQVQDNGAGIPSEVMPRIFDLFARGELGLQRSPGGLGIGLTLVKRIAELHGGQAEAASNGPGFGSTFTVRLPRIAAEQARRPQSDGELEAPLNRLRIVLIEDNDDARQSLRAWLELAGHEIYEAADGPAGVEKVLEVRPQVALIDIGLPGLDGYEVAARIRTAPAGGDTVLIALTGYGQNEYRAKGARAGFHGYLVKPVDTDELDRLIAACDSGSSARIRAVQGT